MHQQRSGVVFLLTLRFFREILRHVFFSNCLNKERARRKGSLLKGNDCTQCEFQKADFKWC